MTSFVRRLAAERRDEVALADGRVRLGLEQDKIDYLLNRMVERLWASDLGSARRVFAGS